MAKILTAIAEKTKSLEQETSTSAELVVCKPFDFKSDIPPRQLIEVNGCKSYAKGFLSVTGAAGGTGKSSLAIVEELSMAMGVDLFLPDRPPLRCGALRVWSMSLEDDETEHRRRVTAAMRYYGIEPHQVEGNYFVTYKSDSPIEVVRGIERGSWYVTPQVDEINAIVSEHGIDVINVDPFVNTHSVSENDNGAMNKVADTWRSIAQSNTVAIGLTHHIRKTNGSEVDAESLRGAVSLVAAARLVRVLAGMGRDEAKTLGIEDERRRFYFWVNPSAKANIAPPASNRIWYHIASLDLNNSTGVWESDKVGVVESWVVPDSLDGVTGNDVQKLARILIDASDEFLLDRCRKSCQPSSIDKWIGTLVGEILEIDSESEIEKAKIKKIIKEWVRCQVLEEVKLLDETRRLRPCFRLGNSAKTVVIDL